MNTLNFGYNSSSSSHYDRFPLRPVAPAPHLNPASAYTPTRPCSSPEDEIAPVNYPPTNAAAILHFRTTSLGRESSTSDERVSTPGYENCSGNYVGFIHQKGGSIELKSVPISVNNNNNNNNNSSNSNSINYYHNHNTKSKISLEEQQNFIESSSEHSGYYSSKKLLNGGVNGSYNTVNGAPGTDRNSKYLAAEKTRSFDHVTLSSADEYFMTLDQNRIQTMSSYNSNNPPNRCRVFSLLILCLLSVLTICVSIILISFTNIFTCNTRFLCLSESGTSENEFSEKSAKDRLLPNNTQDKWNDYKLPADVIPIHYNLLLNIDDGRRKKFFGNVSIKFSVKEYTKHIILHASPKVSPFEKKMKHASVISKMPDLCNSFMNSNGQVRDLNMVR